jgi:hypothetical protein
VRNIALCLIGLSLTLQAAPPTLTSLFPAGGQLGTTFPITLLGKVNAGKTVVWVEGSGVQISKPDAKGKATCTVSEDAELGLRLVRLYDEEGASEMRWLSVGVLPETSEIEPNDSLSGGQGLDKLPLSLNGVLAKSGDIDGFTFEVAAGQSVVALAEAYSLGSPIDAVLNLYDESGVRLATAHDGRNLDPVLMFPVTKAGRYTLQISGFAHPPTADVKFTGGPTVVYRMHVTTGPAALRVFPPVVGVGVNSKVDLRGANLGNKETTFEVEGSRFMHVGQSERIHLPRWTLGPLEVLTSSIIPVIEKEPNNQTAEAMRLGVPGILAGSISGVGDVDRFSFVSKKGERWTMGVRSKQLGLPLDATLRVESTDGKALASNDDQGDQSDPMVDFTAPADGNYQIVVTDLFDKGGPSHEYVVDIAATKPDLEATLSGPDAFVLDAGKSIGIAGKIKRLGGLKERLVASVEGLPLGVAADCQIDEKSGDLKVKLIAAMDARAASCSLRIAVLAVDTKPPVFRMANRSLRGESKRGTTQLDFSPEIWLTVIPSKPEPAKRAEVPPLGSLGK